MRTAKLLLPAIAASLVFGCTKGQIQEVTGINSVDKTSFEAELCDVCPITKTSTLNEGDNIVAVLWNPGDDINVFQVSGDVVTEGHFVNVTTEPSTIADFSGTMPSSGQSGSSASSSVYWALYPYSADNTCTGKAVSFSLSAAQSCPAGTFADGQWPTMARSNGLNFAFYSICSGIMFKVAGEGVTSVRFTNRDGGAINGRVTAAWDSAGRPVIKSVRGTDSVVVTPADSDTFQVGAMYYVVLPVVTMSKGLEVTYRTADSYCTYVINRSVSFQRNIFNRLYGKDTEYIKIPKVTFYEVSEAEAGQSYMIVSNGFAMKNDAGSVKAESVSVNDGEIEIADTAGLMWTAGEPFSTTDTNFSGLSFSNGSKSLYRSSSSISLRSSVSDKFSNFAYIKHHGVSGACCLKSGASYYAYYSTGDSIWKAGASSSNTTVSLYSLTRPKQTQELSFDSPSVSWILGTDYQIGGSYSVQSVKNAQTSVTYSSSDTSVATVSGSKITVKDAGTVTITATAVENDIYKEASASYSLTIVGEEVEEFNLENTYVSQYLDEAAQKYTDSNWASTTVVQKYCSNSNSNRKDIPAPVTLSWTAVSGSGKYTVSIYNDASRSDLETSVTTSSTSASIYNLTPGRKYYYSVVKGVKSVKSGAISTSGRVRMIKVSDSNYIGHAINCRDLGGKVTTDGKTVKYGMLFRGSNMDATSTAEKEYISSYLNVSLDVDLRNGKTTKFDEDGSGYAYDSFKGAYGVSYDCGDFEGGDDILPTDKDARRKITKIFTDILSAFSAGKAAYIHCRIGADRTGYICMLLEAVLGVSPKDCSIDFELTSFSKVGTRLRDGNINSSGLETYYYIDEYVNGGTFKDNAYQLLLDYGVSPEQISLFRKYMLE